MKVLLWNTEWAPPGSKREACIVEIARREAPDVACITEGYLQTWSTCGFVTSSEPDFDYPIVSGRRKVILVSKHEWTSVDTCGSELLPPGRFVSGQTLGLKWIGVCIPWKDAHVRTGHKDRQPWQDHLAFLGALPAAIQTGESEPCVLLGDFNQRLPRTTAPASVYEALVGVLTGRFEAVTDGILHPEGQPSIDHVCFTQRPAAVHVRTIAPLRDGLRLSDHFGVIVEFP